MQEPAPTTDFGFQEVPVGEKRARVRAVFDSVAPRYDLMNDLMSGGLHRLWKRFAVGLAAVQPGECVLDLAGGTGDLARLMAPRVAPGGRVIVADINAAMLNHGRDRLLDSGHAAGIEYLQCDAQSLPLPDGSVDCITMAFGLRNVTDKAAALAEMHRVLRRGGRALVLEFSTPVVGALRAAYDRYSFAVLPRLGRWVARDEDSYRYLAESIRRHPDQDTLAGMMAGAGFARVRYYNLVGGIVALHRGYRL